MDLQHTFGHKKLRLRLVHVKVFPENRYFPEMLFSGKENVFMCLVAFQKMFQKVFSDVWLCSWKYHRKHIFYLLLTFSHIFSITKRIHNIIHSSKHKQNSEKNHQIRTNEDEIAITITIEIGVNEIGEIVITRWCLGCSLITSIGAVPVIMLIILSFSRWVCFVRVGFFLSVALSIFCACYGKCLKVKRFCKMISGSTSANFGQTKIIFRKIYFP